MITRHNSRSQRRGRRLVSTAVAVAALAGLNTGVAQAAGRTPSQPPPAHSWIHPQPAKAVVQRAIADSAARPASATAL